MPHSDDAFSDEEAQRRMDAAVRRALNTPPQPKKTKCAAEADAMLDYVILDGRMLVAAIRERDGRSITADLYRNPEDFRKGMAIERGVRLQDQ